MDHHPPGLSPSAAWDYYYAHRDEKLDLILLSAYSTGVEPAELVPQSLYALQLRAVSGQAGQLGLGAGSRAFRALRRWLEAQDAGALLLGTDCLECGVLGLLCRALQCVL